MTARLTGADREIVARARQLADAMGMDALRAATGANPELDIALVHADALGLAQHLLAGLVSIIERTAAEAGDTRRLAAIREVLARFDWELDDRQYALEAIERIVNEGITSEGSN